MSLFENKKVMLALERWCFPDDMKSKISVVEYRRRIYIFVAVIIGSPILLYYGIFGMLHYENPWLAVPDISFSVVTLGIGVILRRVERADFIYRIAMLFFSALMLFNVTQGFYGGGDVLWLYTFPLIAFTVFGHKEGIIWVALVILPAAIAISIPNFIAAKTVPETFTMQFHASIGLTVVLSYFLESVRASFYKELVDQKAELQDALDNVETLSGLVPICASCKKIRNDEGYWQHLETYLTEHTKAQFSHGICMKCLKSENPEIYQEMKEAGEIEVKDRLTPSPDKSPTEG